MDVALSRSCFEPMIALLQHQRACLHSNAVQEYPNNALWDYIYYGKEDSKVIELVYGSGQQTQASLLRIEFVLRYFRNRYQF